MAIMDSNKHNLESCIVFSFKHEICYEYVTKLEKQFI